MAKLVKKKRKLKFLVKSSFLLSVALMMLLLSNIICGSFNTRYTMEIQTTQSEIATLSVQNEQLNVDIQTLQNKDRVYTIAQDAGLNQNDDNIISVVGATLEAE